MRSIFLFLLLLFTMGAWAESDSEVTLSFESIVEAESLKKGDSVTLALDIIIPAHYHLYGNPMGPGLGKPLMLTVKSSGVTWSSALIDKPSKFEPEGMEDLWTWSYEDKVTVQFVGVLSQEITSGTKGTVIVDGLVCKTACIPVYGEHEFVIEVGKSVTALASSQEVPFTSEEVEATNQGSTSVETVGTEDGTSEKESASADAAGEVKEEKSLSVGWALVFAFIAGVILNFMPCVLPVLGIKILSFSKGREGSKAEAVSHSIAFAVGMILVFMVLATFAAFAGLSWGEQFQNPVFIISLVSMIFVFALGMFDLFMILVPAKLSEMEMKSSKDDLRGNFFKGIFATILATPCSGPFLGATLAWTLTQPPLVIYMVFFSLGLGMASPYILLASSSRLSKMVPKPGAWMDDFKHFLGFFLFGFAVYLLSTLPMNYIVPTVGLQVVLAFAVILYTRIAPFGVAFKRKVIALLIALSIVVLGTHLNYNVLFKADAVAQVKTDPLVRTTWNSFYQDEFDKALTNKEDIIIDFTAKWCLNCQYNKNTVYNTNKMKEAIKEKGIYAIRGDLTQEDKELKALRDKLGSRSIPFLVLIPKGDTTKAIRLRDLVKPSDVYGAMEELYGPLKTK